MIEYGNYIMAKHPRCTPEMKAALIKESKKWPEMSNQTEKWYFQRQWVAQDERGDWVQIPFIPKIPKMRIWIVGLKVSGERK